MKEKKKTYALIVLVVVFRRNKRQQAVKGLSMAFEPILYHTHWQPGSTTFFFFLSLSSLLFSFSFTLFPPYPKKREGKKKEGLVTEELEDGVCRHTSRLSSMMLRVQWPAMASGEGRGGYETRGIERCVTRAVARVMILQQKRLGCCVFVLVGTKNYFSRQGGGECGVKKVVYVCVCVCVCVCFGLT